MGVVRKTGDNEYSRRVWRESLLQRLVSQGGSGEAHVKIMDI